MSGERELAKAADSRISADGNRSDLQSDPRAEHETNKTAEVQKNKKAFDDVKTTIKDHPGDGSWTTEEKQLRMGIDLAGKLGKVDELGQILSTFDMQDEHSRQSLNKVMGQVQQDLRSMGIDSKWVSTYEEKPIQTDSDYFKDLADGQARKDAFNNVYTPVYYGEFHISYDPKSAPIEISTPKPDGEFWQALRPDYDPRFDISDRDYDEINQLKQ